MTHQDEELESLRSPDDDIDETVARLRKTRAPLVGLLIALVVFSIGYRLIVGVELEQSSMLFIGLPAVFAVLLSYTEPPKSGIGLVLKGTTLALLMSMVLLGEGMICVLMAAPIIYAVILAVWGLIALFERVFNKNVARCSVALPLALVSLEGTTEALSFERHEQVAVSRTTNAEPAAVVERLAAPPRFNHALPPLLQAGFPRPQWIESDGIEPGDQWRIRFAGGEGQPGTLVLEVVERAPGRVRFAAVEDDTKIAHWLTWREAMVEWEVGPTGGTEVTWTLTYDRELDPAWYFAPLERYAVALAAGFLIDNLAVPE